MSENEELVPQESVIEQSSDCVTAPEASIPNNVWATLREAREAREWSVEEVSVRLKLIPRQIEAMETGALDLLPETAFVRGFIKNYARLLELDPSPLLRALDPVCATDAPLKEVALVPLEHKRSFKTVWILLLMAVLAALALMSWGGKWFEHQAMPTAPLVQSQPEALPVVVPESQPLADLTSATSQASAPVEAGAASAPALSHELEAGKQLLSFKYAGESWTGVSDGKGALIFSQTSKPDSTLELQVEEPFSLVVGNARAVALTYRGQVVDLTPFIRSGGVARLTFPQK